MQKINAIFSDLLDLRKNSAISFNDAGENETYSAKIYWEYLNRLKEAIQNQLNAFNFFVRLVIKDNIVQIEIFLPDCNPPEHTPYAVFQFGHESDVPQNIKEFYKKEGQFYFNETFQQAHTIDAEQIHAVFDNLTKYLAINAGNIPQQYMPISESANYYWRKLLIKNYKIPTLLKLIDILEDIKEASGDEFKQILDKKITKLKEFDERLLVLSSEIDSIMEDMKFDFLYNNERGLFAIGYNVEEKSLGNSYYDLMASESRIASFLTIARGEIPKEHWYNLSRNISKALDYKTLVSWSGTMFEYFMPYQLMKSFDNTIWSLTYSSVLKAQKAYGDKKYIPWGISESAYYVFDINQVYQYKAFGVPGIGLKRGLEDEVVVSPYSSIMTLPLDAKASLDNLKNLFDMNAYGRYGFIEAIDYSEGKDNPKEVRCYMVHHLGMSLLALDNVLNNNILKERFHSIPEIKAAEILLKERVPEYVVFDRDVEISNINNKVMEREEFIPRVFNGSKKENPEVLLLSNGNYSTMISHNLSSSIVGRLST